MPVIARHDNSDGSLSISLPKFRTGANGCISIRLDDFTRISSSRLLYWSAAISYLDCEIAFVLIALPASLVFSPEFPSAPLVLS
jgi:hypothetical protein